MIPNEKKVEDRIARDVESKTSVRRPSSDVSGVFKVEKEVTRVIRLTVALQNEARRELEDVSPDLEVENNDLQWKKEG